MTSHSSLQRQRRDNKTLEDNGLKPRTRRQLANRSQPIPSGFQRVAPTAPCPTLTDTTRLNSSLVGGHTSIMGMDGTSTNTAPAAYARSQWNIAKSMLVCIVGLSL
ncbi:uncharacterized protein FFB20_09422 [Fusarium fujikuroi]|nr:uncharacterized protein FFB20_09422 [Fusarium fujikuroi]SCN95489.1 uncharacterized protein FFE2_08235 [Fusarium fujikuroi]SCO01380.1 uncharacterized protein FFM5_07559 [Fusarium fujikuroi]SCO21442.1 uncharacterized protein FFC1_14163 [Fusarium fujikuroi]SCO46100.1 uncharacterized protein FFNC_10679 [Fusarium fujikuroi]